MTLLQIDTALAVDTSDRLAQRSSELATERAAVLDSAGSVGCAEFAASFGASVQAAIELVDAAATLLELKSEQMYHASRGLDFLASSLSHNVAAAEGALALAIAGVNGLPEEACDASGLSLERWQDGVNLSAQERLDIITAYGEMSGHATAMKNIFDFTEWEINSGRIPRRDGGPMAGGEGSEWWKGMNGAMVVHMAEAMELAEQGVTESCDPGVQPWLDLLNTDQGHNSLSVNEALASRALFSAPVFGPWASAAYDTYEYVVKPSDEFIEQFWFAHNNSLDIASTSPWAEEALSLEGSEEVALTEVIMQNVTWTENQKLDPTLLGGNGVDIFVDVVIEYPGYPFDGDASDYSADSYTDVGLHVAGALWDLQVDAASTVVDAAHDAASTVVDVAQDVVFNDVVYNPVVDGIDSIMGWFG